MPALLHRGRPNPPPDRGGTGARTDFCPALSFYPATGQTQATSTAPGDRPSHSSMPMASNTYAPLPSPLTGRRCAAIGVTRPEVR